MNKSWLLIGRGWVHNSVMMACDDNVWAILCKYILPPSQSLGLNRGCMTSSQNRLVENNPFQHLLKKLFWNDCWKLSWKGANFCCWVLCGVDFVIFRFVAECPNPLHKNVSWLGDYSSITTPGFGREGRQGRQIWPLIGQCVPILDSDWLIAPQLPRISTKRLVWLYHASNPPFSTWEQIVSLNSQQDPKLNGKI